MTRIENLFASLGERKVLVGYLTAGDPTPEHTVAALHGLVSGGVDMLEVGIPFSDPEAEGPSIQAACERALANGMTLVKVLDMVKEFRRQNADTPIVLMGYLNSVLAMPDFAERAQQAGVDGLIMVNLPPEAADELREQLAEHQLNLIFLIAPTTTDERAAKILSKASGFVYYVSLKGTTGAGNLQVDEVGARLDKLTAMSDLPFCVGFGVKDADSARNVARHADGVVVGSALVDLLAAHADDVEAGVQALEQMAAQLRAGVDSA